MFASTVEIECKFNDYFYMPEKYSEKPSNLPITTELLKAIQVGLNLIICSTNDLDTNEVICKSPEKVTQHKSISSLLGQIPELGLTNYYSTLAKIINFLCSGYEYQLIEDPEEYKQRYYAQLEKEENNYLNSSLSYYGCYNVEEISKPRKEGNNFIFYVEKIIPYKVTCSNVGITPLSYSYSILPYKY